METIVASLATMGGLGVLFAGALAVADKKLRVEEDPRIAVVNDALPGANCGACGYAGCAAYAEAVVSGQAKVNQCPVGGMDTATTVGAIMGVSAGEMTRHVVRLMCRGTGALSHAKALYEGPTACSVQELVAGGEKACQWGCLGGGDCVAACTFGAIEMGPEGLPVVYDDLCTACAACVTACPRDILELHPVDREFFVFCKSHDDARLAKWACDAACISCGICARKSDGAIVIIDNLPVIDYAKLDATIIPLDKCKPGSIGWLHADKAPAAPGSDAVN